MAKTHETCVFCGNLVYVHGHVYDVHLKFKEKVVCSRCLSKQNHREPSLQIAKEKKPLFFELIEELGHPEVLSPGTFYSRVVEDISHAKSKEEIVVFSPLISRERVGELIPRIKESKGKTVIFTLNPRSPVHEENIKSLRIVKKRTSTFLSCCG